MASFSDLPNELVVEIWSHILQPKDIENFALASKTIRTLAGKILVDHRKLTRELSTFDISDSKSRFSPAGLLKEILTNPRVALYTKTVIISGLFHGWESEEKGVNTLKASDPEAGEDESQYRHTPYAEEDMELFKQVMEKAKQFFDFKHLRQCQTTTSAKYKIDHLRTIMEKHGSERPIMVLLLLLFTNLKTVAIEYAGAYDCFFDVLQYISEGRGIPILKRLIKVKILNAHEEHAEVCLRRMSSATLPSSTNTKGEIPWVVGPDHSFSFDLRAWSMNVDGMWTL